jgi:hypothetical protein
MPQLRTTDARLQSARRLASEKLLHFHQYTWSSEDQEEFEDSFRATIIKTLSRRE